MTAPKPGEPDYLLNIKQIASYLHLSPMSVYRILHVGEMAYVRVGRGYRVRQDEFDDYLKRQTVERKSKTDV
jgi:excisionase family DNA binding protein